jgi:hypothetical protein
MLDEVKQRSCTFQRLHKSLPLVDPGAEPADLLHRFTENARRYGKYLAACQKVARGADLTLHPGQDSLEALWRTLLCNRDIECRAPAAKLGNNYRLLHSLCSSAMHGTDTKTLSLLPPQVIELCQQSALFESVALNKAAPGRRFCNNKKG